MGEGKGGVARPLFDAGILQLCCLAPFGGSGACVLTENDPVSDGGHFAVGVVEFSFGNEPACHTIGDHSLPVGDILIVHHGIEDDFNVFLLGIEREFSFIEQLVSRREVVGQDFVADGGAEDYLALD